MLGTSDLEQCLQQLSRLGKKFGGFVTYQIIKDVFGSKKCDISLEILDTIYEYLTAQGIRLVDQLPDTDALVVVTKSQAPSSARYKGFRKQRVQCYDPAGDENLAPLFCPEEAIDRLLLRWKRTGQLSSSFFTAIVKQYYLSDQEINQLVDYLGSKGVDIPEEYIYRRYLLNSQMEFLLFGKY